jgi:hypothetical protein
VRYRGSPSHVAWPELENPPNAEWFGGGVKKLSEESPGHRPNAHAQRPSVARIRPDNFLTPAAGDFHTQILILSHIGRACADIDSGADVPANPLCQFSCIHEGDREGVGNTRSFS